MGPDHPFLRFVVCLWWLGKDVQDCRGVVVIEMLWGASQHLAAVETLSQGLEV